MVNSPGRLAEWRAGWRVVAGAASGVGLGMAGLLTYNSGLFVPALEGEIGLTRTAYGAALFGSTVLMALAMPLVGRMVDRHGPRVVAATGSAMLAGGFIALSQVGSLAMYLVLMIAIGLLASGSTPVAHTRAVASSFERSRGLAFGITQMGIGLSAALVPPLVGSVIAAEGWRAGFYLLAGLAAVGIVPILLFLPRRVAAALDPAAALEAWRALRRRPVFIMQTATFGLMALAFAGLLSHFVPMLAQLGMPLAEAGALAGAIGASVIVTRVIVGALCDVIDPAWLGAVSCLVCAAGLLVLVIGGPDMAIVAAIALGAAIGAEADLIGIMTARNFGVAAYSQAYGFQYGVFMLCAGLSPLWIGLLADRTGNYDAAVYAAAGLLVLPAMLFLVAARQGRPAAAG